jgi:hypothetical protein
MNIPTLVLTPEEEEELHKALIKIAEETPQLTEEELRVALAKEGCYDPEWYR